MTSGTVLAVEDLTMHYMTRAGVVRAVDGVSFSVERGQSLGLVGESGCGKSSIAITLLKLLPDNARVVSGSISLSGVDLVPLDEEQMRAYRWSRISMVFQAAMNSLDPVYRVGDQIVEALEAHYATSHQEAMERVRELYDLVGLDPSFIPRYPHEYSGGMMHTLTQRRYGWCWTTSTLTSWARCTMPSSQPKRGASPSAWSSTTLLYTAVG